MWKKEQLDKIIYTNVTSYQISDESCENLCLKAKEYGIRRILAAPSGLSVCCRLLKHTPVEIAAAVSYPAGANEVDCKENEISLILDKFPEVTWLYAVFATGRFQSGYFKEAEEEIRRLTEAAKGRKLCLIIEAGMMTIEQISWVCQVCEQYGAAGIMSSTGFHHYQLTMPDQEKIRQIRKFLTPGTELTAAGFIPEPGRAEQFLKAGADKILMSSLKGCCE